MFCIWFWWSLWNCNFIVVVFIGSCVSYSPNKYNLLFSFESVDSSCGAWRDGSCLADTYKEMPRLSRRSLIKVVDLCSTTTLPHAQPFLWHYSVWHNNHGVCFLAVTVHSPTCLCKLMLPVVCVHAVRTNLSGRELQGCWGMHYPTIPAVSTAERESASTVVIGWEEKQHHQP